MCHPYAGAMLIFSVFFQFRLVPHPKVGKEEGGPIVYIGIQSKLESSQAPPPGDWLFSIGNIRRWSFEVSISSYQPSIRSSRGNESRCTAAILLSKKSKETFTWTDDPTQLSPSSFAYHGQKCWDEQFKDFDYTAGRK